jgi:voltage-gated potassium channel
MRIRKRTYDILDPGHSADPLSRAANYVIYSLIFLNVVFIILESVPWICNGWAPWFFGFEVLTVAVFSIEYVLRIWTCVESPRFSSPVTGRLRYVVSFMALVDLLAILPFYLPFFHSNWLFLRSVRFFRLFRMLKLGRYSTAFRLLGSVLNAKRAELLATVFIIVVLTILSGTAIYYVENEAQPQVFPDVPSSMFWAIATLTNVGHADPVTPLGKCLASVIFILGLGMFALPTGILGAGFVEEFQNRRKKPMRCPHCGKEIVPEAGTGAVEHGSK